MNSFSYIPNTNDDREYMLRELGMKGIDDLFSDIPPLVKLKRDLELPAAASEWELMQELRRLAGKNVELGHAISLIGAGAYRHYIPSVIDAVIGRSEFYTAYTPYQPEISQGMLQAIFEYQSLVANLMGLDVSNASLYDGPTSLGEAAVVACAHTRRSKILVSRTVHPEYRQVLQTYVSGQHIVYQEIPMIDGQIDMQRLEIELSDEIAAVIIQYPNFFGGIENVRAMAELAHAHGALFVVSANPISLGLLESPGKLGADIAIAEGQPLGNSLQFGGPYLGVMAATSALTRRLPGRIVGQTKDHDGRRGFVLTLQAREQHIRREKASSNICSNQALNALAASVYLSYMGPKGLNEVASQCFAKAHFAAKLFKQAGVSIAFKGPFFHEFVIKVADGARIWRQLADEHIFLGYPLADAYPELQDHYVVAITEVVSREQLEHVAKRLEEIR
ncbi:MAG: aminomethyl-transferring glycine dehydrogenase subunit GcvPA [Acidibacillus sp.]|uniref:Probable glycine dehydrogenase (decarboxylating) subunit 1 n=1 Tax=Sulfoacidibacillus ferrooxidans TaxID=2005001 RepID=A0A9X2ADA0_9BACL|nr:putative glycine dehydrogenase (decarboxylating) subunit 1 [Sulfoacidibacillus ferrooxidans]MCY0893130.1 aminomethyl-transferring glycine dehydrogenase subunit GcvPA [Acidibacillus sp.]